MNICYKFIQLTQDIQFSGNCLLISWDRQLVNLYQTLKLDIKNAYFSHYIFKQDKDTYQRKFYLLKKELENIKNDIESSHNVIFDLRGFYPNDEKDICLVECILLNLYNCMYQISDLGFKSEHQERKVLFYLLIENNFPLWEKINNEYVILATAMLRARKLADLPANIANPLYFSEYLQRYSERKNIKVNLFNNDHLLKYGFNTLYNVGKASAYSSYLVKIDYDANLEDKRRYIFVGKGITFDSGGLWLKDGIQMSTMKYDMCGAAVLIGLLDAIIEMNLLLNVSMILGFAENLVSHNSIRPGDVIKTYSGKSVEIINTDAEGRLILADLLSYAVEHNPTHIIDIATLTGAIVKALGYDINGAMSNDDELVKKFQLASTQSNQRIWRLPCDESFEPQIQSQIADLTNTPPNNAAISISAAYFLQSFVKETSWLHLDISGTALSRDKGVYANGNPLPLLYHFLKNELIQSN